MYSTASTNSGLEASVAKHHRSTREEHYCIFSSTEQKQKQEATVWQELAAAAAFGYSTKLARESINQEV